LAYFRQENRMPCRGRHAFSKPKDLDKTKLNLRFAPQAQDFSPELLPSPAIRYLEPLQDSSQCQFRL
jgi:hypothetical protein